MEEFKVRRYGRPGSKRLTPFKRGYLDGLGAGTHSYSGRKAKAYRRGYACGIFWSSFRFCEEIDKQDAIMDAKSKVLILRPDAEIQEENHGGNTQSRLSVVSQGEVLAWNWGVKGVAGYETPIWEEALNLLLHGGEESVEV